MNCGMFCVRLFNASPANSHTLFFDFVFFLLFSSLMYSRNTHAIYIYFFIFDKIRYVFTPIFLLCVVHTKDIIQSTEWKQQETYLYSTKIAAKNSTLRIERTRDGTEKHAGTHSRIHYMYVCLNRGHFLLLYFPFPLLLSRPLPFVFGTKSIYFYDDIHLLFGRE